MNSWIEGPREGGAQVTKNKECFVDNREYRQMMTVLEDWANDPRTAKGLFLDLKSKLTQKKDVTLRFHSRSGVSHSLRATVNNRGKKHRPLFVLVDIIDDDPDNRWLSVCFYENTITDPNEQDELIPAGILGENGYCFDLYEYDKNMVSYMGKRIDEAYRYMTTTK